MAAITRHVTWGQGLVVEAFKVDRGGLRHVVDVIRAEVGPTIGVRNTFSKLYDVTDPEMLDGRDKWRAWLLLTALHQDPADWGIDRSVVPPSVDAEALAQRLRDQVLVRHQGLEPRTRWFDVDPDADGSGRGNDLSVRYTDGWFVTEWPEQPNAA